MSGPDKSYGWYTAHNFNDYMEKVIGTYVKFCADRVWNGEFALNIIGIIKFFTFTFSPEYQVKQEEAHPRPDTALVITHSIIYTLNDVITHHY